jgi:hypothetical protein
MDNVLYSTITKQRMRYAKECCSLLKERYATLATATDVLATPPRKRRYNIYNPNPNAEAILEWPVDVSSRSDGEIICEYDMDTVSGCSRYATHNFEEDGVGRFCSTHKLEGMVEIRAGDRNGTSNDSSEEAELMHDEQHDENSDLEEDDEYALMHHNEEEWKRIKGRLDVRLGMTKVSCLFFKIFVFSPVIVV